MALLMVLSVFSCLTLTASAAYVVDQYKDTVEDEEGGSEEVTFWILYSDGKLTINKIPYDDEAGAYIVNWTGYRNMVTSVEFKEQDIIPARLFDGYPNLESVDLGSIVRVDGYAFQNCPKLTDVKVGVLFHTLGDYAFYNCPALKEIDLGSCLGDNNIVGAEDAYVGKNIFKDCTGLEKVTFGNGCREVGYGMFENCSALKSVSLGDSIVRIGDLAFLGCASLESVIIPDSTEEIGAFAFSECASLKSAVIGHNASAIGKYAFNGCASLVDITIKSAVTEISEGCFKDCTSLTSVKLPVSVDKIGNDAFNGCTLLGKITLGDSVSEIGRTAFYKTALTEIDVPASVETIGDGAFASCDVLTAVNVAEMNKKYKSVDGVLYNNSLTTLIFCPAGKEGTVEVPASVTALGENAFVGCKKLSTVKIGKNVTDIPANAFNGSEKVIIETTCDTQAAKFAKEMGMDTTGISHVGSENWVTALDPTCEISGKKEKKCDGCEEVIETSVIPAIGHLYDDGEVIKKATCEEDGTIKYSCVNEGCKNYYIDTVKKLGHKLDNGTVTKEATCDEEGILTFTCTHEGCEYEETKKIPKLSHYFDEGTVKVEPTCEKDGVMIYRCTQEGCKYFYEQPIKSLGHNLDKGTVTKEPTCEEDGVMTFACKNEGCDYEETQKIVKLGHDYDDGVLTLAPTPTKDGEMTYSCKRSGCNASYKIPVPATPLYSANYNEKGKIVSYNWKYDDVAKALTIYNFSNFDFGMYSASTEVLTVLADSIPGRTFYEWKNLAKVNISGVETIGDYAFDNCDKIETLNISEIVSLGNYAFYDCDGLTDVVIGNCLENCGNNAFKNCDNLKNVTVYNGSTVIGYGMFEGCKVLENVELPDSIIEIDAHAFEECTALTNAYVPDSVEKVGDYAFYRCSGIKSAYIGHNANTLGAYLFAECTSLEDAEIKSSVNEISDHMFYKCTSLKEFKDFPASVKAIKDSAFEECTSLLSISLPATVETIGKNAFYNCKSLKKADFGSYIKEIGECAFCNTGLEEVNFPASLNNIDLSAFAECKKLKAINVAEENKNYKSTDGILYNADRTELIICPVAKEGDVSVPYTVTSIGNAAFSGCKKITSVKIGANVTNIPENAFVNCSDELVIITDCDTQAAKFVAESGMLTTGIKHNGGTEWVEVTAPTCYEDGEKALVCKGCGVVFETKSIDALEHSYSSVVTTPATCEGKGLITYTCAHCGDTYTKDISPIGHKYTSEVTKDATCEDAGIRTYTCIHEGCGDTYTEEIKALGHKLGDGVVTKAATCEEDGVMTYTCIHDGCEYFETDVIPATGHKLGDGVITKPAKCEEDGVMTYTCTHSGCEYFETDVIPATGHKLGDGVVTKEATCEEDGVMTYTCIHSGCEYFETDVIPATGHSYGEGVVVKEADCRGLREITYTCAGCGDVKTEYVPGEHHYFNTYSVDKAPTKTETGLQSHHCAICGASAGDYVVIPATGEVTPPASKLSKPVMYNSKYFEGKGKNNVDFIVKDGISVKWGKVENAVSYTVYRKADNGSYKTVASVKGTTYIDAAVKSGVKYSYKVVAVNGTVKSAESDVLTVLFLATPTVTLKNAKNGITASWNKIAGAETYRVYRKAAGEKNWKVVGDKVTGTSFTDTSVKSGTGYYYTVRAYVGTAQRGYFKSSAKQIFLKAPAVEFTCTSSAVKVSWNKIAGAKGYTVYRKAGNATSWTKIKTITSGSALSFTDKNVKAGTKYTYAVKAVNGNFTSAYIAVSGKFLSVPSLKKAVRSSNGVTVTYGKSAGATGYVIYRKTAGGSYGRVATVKGVNSLSFLDKTAKKGVKYTYTVRAYYGDVKSSYVSKGITVK